MRRRALLAWASLASVATVALLPGCGFALRQTPPLRFTRIALTGFAARSPLATELRERLGGSAQVVDSPAQAEVVLQAINDKRDKSVIASTAAGQVRDLRLRVKFEFRFSTPGGRELIPATELLLTRDMSYSETYALAKMQEEAELYAAMQADIVQQVLRRLSRADPAGPVGTPGTPGPASPAQPTQPTQPTQPASAAQR